MIILNAHFAQAFIQDDPSVYVVIMVLLVLRAISLSPIQHPVVEDVPGVVVDHADPATINLTTVIGIQKKRLA